MIAHRYALFDTLIGRCGIAWGGRGVIGVQLPEARELETRTRLLRRFPDAREALPPPDAQRAINGIVALLRRDASAIEGAQVSGTLPLFDGDGTFGFDPSIAVEHLRASDAALGRIIDAVGPFRMELKKTSSVFGMLAEAIVYQQLTGKAAATIFGRV